MQLDPYLEDLPPSSQRTARIALANFEEWYRGTAGEHWTLENWTAQDTRAWLAYLLNVRKPRLEPTTINTLLGPVLMVCAVTAAMK